MLGRSMARSPTGTNPPRSPRFCCSSLLIEAPCRRLVDHSWAALEDRLKDAVIVAGGIFGNFLRVGLFYVVKAKPPTGRPERDPIVGPFRSLILSPVSRT